ncbi:LemA family protein [Patescibacteria group bacterium]|nr:LemA family protein [Patescibacteria group bacterium]MBU1890528.1 LemA family protein [Patescibacteria group bacterium]
MSTPLWIVIIAIVVLIIWFIGVYNSLIRLKNQTNEAWSDIDVQLKRRYNLIPNLVETVKGYATHEREVFEKVTQARSQAMGVQNPADKAKAENMLSGALKSLFAVAENYPGLKASENFAKLQDELSDTENKVQAARRFYNGNVRDFNTKLESFPNNMVAGMFGFNKREFFEIEDEGERKNPEVKF